METHEVLRTTKYIGSKSLQLETIYKYFLEDFDLYLEPFIGSLSVFLNLPMINKWKRGWITKKQLPNFALNDLDIDIVSIAYAILREPDRLYRSFHNFIKSKGLYRKFMEIDSEDLDDYFLKTIRKLYLIYNSFGGAEGNGYSYHVFSKGGKYNSVYPSKDYLYKIQERLSLAEFFNEDWKTFLNIYLTEQNIKTAIKKNYKIMIYLDPPYIVRHKHYKHMKLDHEGLAEYLNQYPDTSKKVYWVLSYNDCEEVRELYKDNFIFEEEWNYPGTTGNKPDEETQKGKELIISNFDKMNKPKSKLEKFF